jgi:spore coat protein U-like protein
MMEMKRKLLGAVALFAVFSAFEANAQSSQSINVTAQVDPTCVINGGGTTLDFDFGVIDITSTADTTQSASFTWRCSDGTAVEIELDTGDSIGSAPATARRLAHASTVGAYLEYLLCQDAACATPWGDGATAADIVTTGAGMGNPATVQIYGVLDGAFAQNAIPGSYQETVVLSLNF